MRFMFIFILYRGSLSCGLLTFFDIRYIGMKRQRAVLCIDATLLLAAAMTHARHTYNSEGGGGLRFIPVYTEECSQIALHYTLHADSFPVITHAVKYLVISAA